MFKRFSRRRTPGGGRGLGRGRGGWGPGGGRRRIRRRDPNCPYWQSREKKDS